MTTGTAELKLQDGIEIKIKGSADFVAAVTAAILEVRNEKSSELEIRGDPSANQFKGLPPMFSSEWHDARSLLLERLGRIPTVGEIFGLLRESSQASKSTNGDFLENHKLEAPAAPPPKLCWSLKEAAERCGVSYHTLYRAACRGDLKIIKGFGRIMVPESELPRFVGNVTEYLPTKRKS